MRANRWRAFQHIKWDGKEETTAVCTSVYDRKELFKVAWALPTLQLFLFLSQLVMQTAVDILER